MRHESFEPCGGLPARWASVSVFYCAHHMAYTVRYSLVRQDGHEQDVEDVESGVCELGPFDGLDEAQRIAGELLRRMLEGLTLQGA